VNLDDSEFFTFYAMPCLVTSGYGNFCSFFTLMISVLTVVCGQLQAMPLSPTTA